MKKEEFKKLYSEFRFYENHLDDYDKSEEFEDRVGPKINYKLWCCYGSSTDQLKRPLKNRLKRYKRLLSKNKLDLFWSKYKTKEKCK